MTLVINLGVLPLYEILFIVNIAIFFPKNRPKKKEHLLNIRLLNI